MKKIKDQMARISRSLATLSRELDRLAKQVPKSGAAGGRPGNSGPGGGKRPSGRRPLTRTDTVLENVYDTIRASRKGISIPDLRTRTGLGARQLSNALYKLTKKGIVKTQSRGIYVKN
jgi:predicted Rossmann fold nucleotide-binding protein DprA/Smf involved in DNA uptake